MTNWFTSDWHMGHRNIRRLANRPFENDHTMHKSIVQNYQQVVEDEDVVYMLGDICWQFQDLPGLLSRLPGHKKLIIGNHDRVFKEVWKLSNTQDKYYHFYLNAGFESIDTVATVDLHTLPKRIWQSGMYYDNQTYQVLLNHFPYRQGKPPTEYVDKYWDKRPVDTGAILLHGHTHEKQPFFDGKNQFNLSVEVTDYTPVSEYVIADIIQRTANSPLQTTLDLYGIQNINIPE